MRVSLPSTPVIGFVLLVSGTILAIAGTDLVLPAVPSLPASLGGTPAKAQLVLAAFVAGTGLGLLVFGEIGARIDPRNVVIGSLALYGVISLMTSLVATLDGLIAMRLVQGAASAAPAVFAPGFVRALFPGSGAVRAIGLFGSIEALVPALAPIAGAWLLVRFGWHASFVVTGTLAMALAALLVVMAPRLPRLAAPEKHQSYLALLRRPVFLRYSLSQAFSLGGLLVFIFGAPAVILGPMQGRLSDFILLEIVGIAFFILGSTVTGRLTDRYGPASLILGGTVLSAAGGWSLVGYALVDGMTPWLLIPPSIVMNIGFGLRGPPGFLHALMAADGDDARGAAIVVLSILMTTAVGTALAAPFVASGLLGLAVIAAAISSGAVLCLLMLPRADERALSKGDPAVRPSD